MGTALTWKLDNPKWTVYHRAALGGLAATVMAWQRNPENAPKGIEASVSNKEVTLAWESVSDRDALKLLLESSFRIHDGLIDLPGQGVSLARIDLRIAIHNALCSTFLQHPKMRPSEKAPRIIPLQDSDGKSLGTLSYKAVTDYAHRKAQGSGLLDGPVPKGAPAGSFPAVATIPQSMIPGATKGVCSLEAAPSEALLLLYLMVGCPVFIVRSRAWEEKAQACVVVPEVCDLKSFARGLVSFASVSADPLQKRKESQSSSYAGRVVGGVEEAALRFLLDLGAERNGVEGAQAIAMGKVAWDPNQINRSLHVHLRRSYAELDVYRVARERLGRAVPIARKDGSVFFVPQSPVPELIAANLGAEVHWCTDFWKLVQEKNDFNRMLYCCRELSNVKNAINDKIDQAVIATFHEAWRWKLKQLKKREEQEGLEDWDRSDKEKEKARNAILRCKTADSLAGWFLQFCADASKGAALPTLQEHGTLLRPFLFDRRNAARLQNLLLFALVSYAKKEEPDSNNSSPDTKKDN